jgi:hypothetical protein
MRVRIPPGLRGRCPRHAALPERQRRPAQDRKNQVQGPWNCTSQGPPGRPTREAAQSQGFTRGGSDGSVQRTGETVSPCRGRLILLLLLLPPPPGSGSLWRSRHGARPQSGRKRFAPTHRS